MAKTRNRRPQPTSPPRQQARRWRGLFEVLLKLSEVARLDTATLRAVKEEAEEALRKEA